MANPKINPDLYVGNTNKKLIDLTTSLTPYVLYNNSSGASTDITLSDIYSNYKYFDVYVTDTWVGCMFHTRVDAKISQYFMVSANVSRSGYNGFMSMAKMFYFDYNKLYKNQYADFIGIYFSYYQNTYEWHDKDDYDILITKVVGWK